MDALEQRRRELRERRSMLADLQAAGARQSAARPAADPAPPPGSATVLSSASPPARIPPHANVSALQAPVSSPVPALAPTHAVERARAQVSITRGQVHVAPSASAPPAPPRTAAALSGDSEFDEPEEAVDNSPLSAGGNRSQPSQSAALREDPAMPVLKHERWTAGRPVVALRWLPEFPTVLLSAHGPRDASPPSHQRQQSQEASLDDPDGVVVIWDVERNELQRALVHTAPLTALAVHPLSPALVIAGTLHGGLVAWDTRSRAPTPMHRTLTSSTSPIYALETADAASPFIISASTDGVLCTWSLADLANPLDSFTVRERGIRNIRVSALGIPINAAFHLAPGSTMLGKRAAVMMAGEDGGLYRADNAGDCWAVNAAVARHDSCITGLSCHPGSARAPQLADLCVTTSLDWSVRLWSAGRHGPGLLLCRLCKGISCPSTDVQWSPTHPGVFAVGDAEGCVSLFDISRPEHGQLVGRYVSSNSGTIGIQRIRWNTDGSVLATGATDGSIRLWCASSVHTKPTDSSWDIVSTRIKQWRACVAGSVSTTAKEIPNAPSYVFSNIPPLGNPMLSA
jgi:WD40 repeat protein